MGKISEKNTRTLITIPKDMKAELIVMAKADNRSFNNLIITVLGKYLNNAQEAQDKRSEEYR